MKQQTIDFLKSLPNALDDGTICKFLFDGENVPEGILLRKLIIALCKDKEALNLENKKMTSILKRYDLYNLVLEE